MTDRYTSQWRTDDKSLIKSKFPSLFGQKPQAIQQPPPDGELPPSPATKRLQPSTLSSSSTSTSTSPRLLVGLANNKSSHLESTSPCASLQRKATPPQVTSPLHSPNSPKLLTRMKLVGSPTTTTNRSVTTTMSSNTTVHRTITRTTKNGKTVTTQSIDEAPSNTTTPTLMKRSLIKMPTETDGAMVIPGSNSLTTSSSSSSTSQKVVKQSSTSTKSTTSSKSVNGSAPQTETVTSSKFEENTTKNEKNVKIAADGTKSIDKTEQKSHKLDENERRILVDYKGAKTDTKIENTKRSDHLRRFLKMKPRRSKSDAGSLEDDPEPKVYEEHSDEESNKKVESYQPVGQIAPDVKFEARYRRTKGNNEDLVPGDSTSTAVVTGPDGTIIPVDGTTGGYHTLTSMLTGFVSGATNKAWCMVQNAYEVACDYYAGTAEWQDWEDSSSDEEDEDEDEDSGTGSDRSKIKVIGYQSQNMILSAKQKALQEAQEKREKNKRRCYLIAEELFKTETDYVRKLNILLLVSEKVSEILTPEISRDMFFDIDVIYKFHHDNLLPELKERIDNWNSNPAIGDIMKRLAPFLKLTTEYVQHFEKATELLETWSKKSSSFAAFLKKSVEHVDYGRMPIPSHMIEPVQRIPRYGLLLRDYIKHLEPNSPDLEDSKKAQVLVEEAALHFETMMKRNSVLGQLLKVQRQLDSQFGIVDPNRELIKEGKLSKISLRNGKPVDRYAFLFNDILLLCSCPSLTRGKRYKVKNVVIMAEIQVSESENKNIANSFYLKTTEKVIELSTHKASEKKLWQNIIWKQVGECTKDKLRILKNDNKGADNINRKYIGKKAPVMSRQKDFAKCQLCIGEFSTLRRKHNCRGCGIVICAKCSSHTAKLTYDKSRASRLCDECFVVLFDQGNHKYSVKSSMNPINKVATVSDTIEKSNFLVSSNNGKNFKRRFCKLLEDGSLCVFKRIEDVNALITLQMDSTTTEKDEIGSPKKTVLKLYTERKMYLLAHEDSNEIHRWFTMFKKFKSISQV